MALADEAIRIGPPPAVDSYLRGDVIIEAAIRSGAEVGEEGGSERERNDKRKRGGRTRKNGSVTLVFSFFLFSKRYFNES